MGINTVNIYIIYLLADQRIRMTDVTPPRSRALDRVLPRAPSIEGTTHHPHVPRPPPLPLLAITHHCSNYIIIVTIITRPHTALLLRSRIIITYNTYYYIIIIIYTFWCHCPSVIVHSVFCSPCTARARSFYPCVTRIIHLYRRIYTRGFPASSPFVYTAIIYAHCV